MQTTKMTEKHKELSKEVETLSEKNYLTPQEQRNLQILKKLKLAYKDKIANINSHSACGCNRDCSNCG